MSCHGDFDILIWGQHGGAVVSTVASQQEIPWVKSTIWPFCVESASSPCVCIGLFGCSGFLPQSNDMHGVRLFGDYEFAIVWVSE